VVRGGDPARAVSVPVAGLKELDLYVVGAPEVVYGAADWADARFIGRDGKETPLGRAGSVRLIEGQLSIDSNLHSGVSGPLQIAGRRFEHGIEMYPNGVGKVRVAVPAGAERLEAFIGIDDWVGPRGAVRFIVAGPEEAARQDLWALAARDFAEDAPRRQMKWEREDQVLQEDWPPGDFAALARRGPVRRAYSAEAAASAAKAGSLVADAPKPLWRRRGEGGSGGVFATRRRRSASPDGRSRRLMVRPTRALPVGLPPGVSAVPEGLQRGRPGDLRSRPGAPDRGGSAVIIVPA
jgi:hypothetical protein